MFLLIHYIKTSSLSKKMMILKIAVSYRIIGTANLQTLHYDIYNNEKN